MQSTNQKTGWPWDEGIQALPKLRGGLPRISIVTPSYNQGPFIEETIRSVLLQRYPNLEYTVMDGGSSDHSVEIIKKYADQIDFWVSEPDLGQSHAINKGLERCTGHIFNWINSDDLLMPGALWAVAKAWMEKPGCIILGHTEFFDASGTLEVMKASGQTLKNFVRFWEAKDWGWAQPGTFVPLADLKAVGAIRQDLKYCLDYHMMVTLLASGIQVKHIDRVLSKFRLHSTSKTVGSKEAFRLERIPTLREMKDLPVDVEDWEWDRQQARRLVDVALNAVRSGRMSHGLRLFGKAIYASPIGAVSEFTSRFHGRLKRKNQPHRAA